MLDFESLSGARHDASPLPRLSEFGDRLAVRTDSETLSYSDLAMRVAEVAERLGPVRRLALVQASQDLDSIVSYLACLEGGHPVLLVPGGHSPHAAALVEAYNPDVVFSAQSGGWQLHERNEGSAHDLHPDLALLLSTSGSTGSPKLVRLSHGNLRSNAESIASYLGITEADRAATTLPLHYCFGLSVLNSHLLKGAGLVLTDLSVVDDCFWDLFESAGASTFSGVPYTFDLLDRSGFADRDLPSLRYVTQAGGRLEPQRVREYAELGQQRGWDFYVMYGQTEATARMAYLPPDAAASQPHAIGVPVPGGSFRLEPVSGVPGTEVGELVYAGPNVMMGYARTPVDLADGARLEELRTGDLARRLPGGLYEIVGRRSRFAKVFGLRIDLDELEIHLRSRGITAWCVARGDQLSVFVTRHSELSTAQSALSEHCDLPLSAVQAAVVESRPVTASGKTNYASLERHAEIVERNRSQTPRKTLRGQVGAADLRDLYAQLLGRPDADLDSSFVSLGGDSLSYVEVSVRLGEVLERLPRDWPAMSVRDLAAPTTSAAPSSRWAFVETSVILRGLAIVLIVGTHANLFTAFGGAHILLAVAGYNFARFQLTTAPRRDRLRHGLTAVAMIAVPSTLWIAGVAATTGFYDAKTAVFLNGLLGSDSWTVQWQFWFLETLIWTMAVTVTVLAIPFVDRLERRSGVWFAFAMLAFGLGLRYALVGLEAGPVERYTPTVVFWCFALGWAAAKATGSFQRLVLTLVMAASVAGFFGDTRREAVIFGGVALLLWLPGLRLPALAAGLIGVVARASLFIYLTHWQIYPHLEDHYPLLAVLASIAVGVAVEWISRPAMRSLGSLLLRSAARLKARPDNRDRRTAALV